MPQLILLDIVLRLFVYLLRLLSVHCSYIICVIYEEVNIINRKSGSYLLLILLQNILSLLFHLMAVPSKSLPLTSLLPIYLPLPSIELLTDLVLFSEQLLIPGPCIFFIVLGDGGSAYIGHGNISGRVILEGLIIQSTIVFDQRDDSLKDFLSFRSSVYTIQIALQDLHFVHHFFVFLLHQIIVMIAMMNALLMMFLHIGPQRGYDVFFVVQFLRELLYSQFSQFQGSLHLIIVNVIPLSVQLQDKLVDFATVMLILQSLLLYLIVQGIILLLEMKLHLKNRSLAGQQLPLQLFYLWMMFHAEIIELLPMLSIRRLQFALQMLLPFMGYIYFPDLFIQHFVDPIQLLLQLLYLNHVLFLSFAFLQLGQIFLTVQLQLSCYLFLSTVVLLRLMMPCLIVVVHIFLRIGSIAKDSIRFLLSFHLAELLFQRRVLQFYQVIIFFIIAEPFVSQARIHTLISLQGSQLLLQVTVQSCSSIIFGYELLISGLIFVQFRLIFVNYLLDRIFFLVQLLVIESQLLIILFILAYGIFQILNQLLVELKFLSELLVVEFIVVDFLMLMIALLMVFQLIMLTSAADMFLQVTNLDFQLLFLYLQLSYLVSQVLVGLVVVLVKDRPLPIYLLLLQLKDIVAAVTLSRSKLVFYFKDLLIQPIDLLLLLLYQTLPFFLASHLYISQIYHLFILIGHLSPQDRDFFLQILIVRIPLDLLRIFSLITTVSIGLQFFSEAIDILDIFILQLLLILHRQFFNLLNLFLQVKIGNAQLLNGFISLLQLHDELFELVSQILPFILLFVDLFHEILNLHEQIRYLIIELIDLLLQVLSVSLFDHSAVTYSSPLQLIVQFLHLLVLLQKTVLQESI